MNTPEHLEKIKAKCETLIANYYSESRAVAGWRSTIAAIDSLRDMGEHDAEMLSANIITDWPEDLLL